jgi:hypothetical protein
MARPLAALINRRTGIALVVGGTRAGSRVILALTSTHLVPTFIKHFDQLFDDLQQSTRVGLNGCHSTELSPVFFVDSHSVKKARTWPPVGPSCGPGGMGNYSYDKSW